MAKDKKDKKGAAQEPARPPEAARHSAKETPRLKARFRKEVAPALMKEFELKNPMAVPHLHKIEFLHQRGSNFLSKPRLQTRRLFSAVPRRLRSSYRLLRRALFVFFVFRHFLITCYHDFGSATDSRAFIFARDPSLCSG